MKKKKLTIGDLNLLPNYFKKIALGLILICLLIAILYLIFYFPLEKEVFLMVFRSVLLVSLVMYVLSKDKEEDELTIRIKLVSLTGAVIYGILTVAFTPIFNLIRGRGFERDIDVNELLFIMLFWYFSINYYLKKRR